MSVDRLLRRVGVHKGAPARRRLLALAITPVCSEAQIERLACYAVECGGIEHGAEQLTAWLESGDWRARWAEADAADRAKESSRWPRERVCGHAWARLRDGRSIEHVAGELGITAAQVRELAIEYAVTRNLPEHCLVEALGMQPPRRWPPWSPANDAAARGEPEPAPSRGELAAAVAEEPPPVRTEAEIRAHYLNLGRRAPAHVIEALTRQAATRSTIDLPQKEPRP